MTNSIDCLYNLCLVSETNCPQNLVVCGNNVLLSLKILQVGWTQLGSSHLGNSEGASQMLAGPVAL